MLPVKRGAWAGVGKLWPTNENGEPILAPPLISSPSYVPWQRPRNAASGAHRKSGVIIRLSYACPAESYLLPSACFLFTPLCKKLQAPSASPPGGPFGGRWSRFDGKLSQNVPKLASLRLTLHPARRDWVEDFHLQAVEHARHTE